MLDSSTWEDPHRGKSTQKGYPPGASFVAHLNLCLTFLWIVSSPGLFRNLFYKGLATEFVGRPPWYTFLVARNPLTWDPFTTSLFLNEFNQALFMEVKSLPRTMATKVVTLISEHFNTKCLNISIPRDLDC